MRVFDFILFVFLMGVIGAGLYVLWSNFPTESKAYTEFASNISNALPARSHQFYPNMRYQESEITYHIESVCSEGKRRDIIRAFEILEEETVLTFTPAVGKPGIRILCSDVAPEPEEEGHFVAGEGGPTEIINTSVYAVILAGKVSLYRTEKCDKPNVALHEILHALGFDHTKDVSSIMYPITNCEQELDSFIVSQINSIYSVESEPDLVIEAVSATISGRYLDFSINVSNYGLEDVQDFDLIIIGHNETVKEFPMESLKMGEKKTLTVKNVRAPRNLESVTFIVKAKEGRELSLGNNRADLTLAS